MPLTRRGVLGIGIAAALYPFAQPVQAKRFVNRTGLEAGQFVWEPSRPPSGAVLILVSRLERLVHVYKNGVLIGISTCTIANGRRTPMGIFTLSDQQEGTRSPARPLEADDSTARDLAWSATALHAVNLDVRSPDCVRVPTAFARLLSAVAQLGTLLIVTDRHTQADMTAHTESLLPLDLGQSWAGISRLTPQAFDTASGDDSIAIFISRADDHAALLRNGVVESRVRINISQPRVPLGTHVYSLLGVNEGGASLRWLGFGLGRSNREPHIADWRGNDVLDRISIQDADAAASMARMLHTGATLIVTDAPGGADWRSPSRDVVVLAASEANVAERSKSARHARRSPSRRSRWANLPNRTR